MARITPESLVRYGIIKKTRVMARHFPPEGFTPLEFIDSLIGPALVEFYGGLQSEAEIKLMIMAELGVIPAPVAYRLSVECAKIALETWERAKPRERDYRAAIELREEILATDPDTEYQGPFPEIFEDDSATIKDCHRILMNSLSSRKRTILDSVRSAVRLDHQGRARRARELIERLGTLLRRGS